MGAFRDSLGSCGFQYTYFDNLIEKTKQTKLFSEFNYDITENSTFHIEGLYSYVDLPEWNTSPSYPPQSLFGTDRLALDDHPGLVDMRATYPDLPQTGYAIPFNRARATTGIEPDGEAEASPRETKTYRLAAGLDGTLFDQQLNYDISVSWSKRERDIGGHDMFIQNMGFAMRGLGGANCDRDAAFANGTEGQGDCEYFNPFSNGVQESVVTGFVNENYNPAAANSPELMDWLITETASSTDNELLVFDAIFSGETGVQLGGGSMAWAMGGQVRRERFDHNLADVVNRSINPCPWTDPLAVELGFTDSLDCATPSGQLAFLAVDTVGNPDLKPEKAVTTNLGFIFQNEVFYGSIDYWRFDFTDSFQTESAQQIANAYFDEGCEIDGAGDGTERCEDLRGHVFPYGTSPAGLERIEVNIINGPDIKTSGLDIFA